MGVLGSGEVSVEQGWSIAALFSFTFWTCLSLEQKDWGQSQNENNSTEPYYLLEN